MLVRIFLLIFLMTMFKVQGQDSGRLFTLKTKIVNESNQPIAFVHVFNESRRYGVISDTNGKFNMRVHIGDTLAFIALGYLGKVYYVQPGDTSVEANIVLTTLIYNIDEVNVIMPKNMDQLKETIFKINPNEGKLDFGFNPYNQYKTPLLLDTNVLDNIFFKIKHPVSGLYYKYSKKEQSKRKVWYLQNQDLHQPEVDAKYNKDLVTKLTGFEGDDLLDFMGYCGFTFNYLYNASELEIMEAIEKKQKEFMSCCYVPSSRTNTEEK